MFRYIEFVDYKGERQGLCMRASVYAVYKEELGKLIDSMFPKKGSMYSFEFSLEEIQENAIIVDKVATGSELFEKAKSELTGSLIVDELSTNAELFRLAALEAKGELEVEDL